MKIPTLKRSSALVLQIAVALIGIGSLVLMLWEPHIEGRNANATTSEIYFKDPFLAYVYAGSIPFFMALLRAFGLFGHVRRTGAFSRATVDSLRAIRNCAIAVMGFVAGAVVIILLFGDKEDRPPGIFMCLLFTVAAGSIAITAAMCARILETALSRSDGSRG